MRLSDLWRTTTFRLSILYGLVFAIGTVALLGMVYVQSAIYLTHRVDAIIHAEADAQMRAPASALHHRIDNALTLSGGRNSVFGLFKPDRTRLAGNLPQLPSQLQPDGDPVDIGPTPGFPAGSRLIARRLPSGEILVVGRDRNQLSEIRHIVASALTWSGLLILITGLTLGAALSIGPIRRLRISQAAANEIAAGNLRRRMPTRQRGDELDMFAGTVNYMMDEVERLMTEVKASSETIAHDLRTPLTRARAQLHRIAQAGGPDAAEISRVTAELDEVLERFRAILRISELETRARSAGFATIELGEVIERVAELYEPLAEEADVRLITATAPAARIEADPKLLFEALSNLVDNAIKFTPPGGHVAVKLEGGLGGARIVVQDDGPGVPAGERTAVLQRFYRSERDRLVPGSGLGLSVVAAIVRLHRFELELDDAEPGLRVVIDTRQKALTA